MKKQEHPNRMIYLNDLIIFSVSLINIQKHTRAFFVNIEFKEELRMRRVLVYIDKDYLKSSFSGLNAKIPSLKKSSDLKPVRSFLFQNEDAGLLTFLYYLRKQ